MNKVAVIISFAGLCRLALGATYYVSISGSDSNPGTRALPFRTIQQSANTMTAGDTALVSPGNYGEYVVTTADGASGAPITFQALPANDPANQVITKQFRVLNRFIVIAGFNITGSANLNLCSIRLDSNGTTLDSSNCIITNNTLRDGVFLITSTATFGSNYIHITDGNFNSVGFTNGSLCFWGSDSMYYYTNHDTKHTVLSNSSDGLTMYVTDTLSYDPGTYWAIIYAGQDNSAYTGILDVQSKGLAPTNCLIVDNTFSNLFGCNIKLYGSQDTVLHNRFFNTHGNIAIEPQGSLLIIRSNLFLNGTHFEFFTPQELASVQHPLGGNFCDYLGNIVSGWTSGGTNCLMEHNWFQNCDNQLGQLQAASSRQGFIVRSNVFVGMQTHGSFSQDGATFDHNTFYRVAFSLGDSIAFGAGGRTWVQTNLVVVSNAFVDVGSHYRTAYEGYFNLGLSTNYTLSSNFCAGAESMGWSPLMNTPGGISINGGDPLFVNPRDPLGPDGLPFTDDDGLRPLPNSPLAIYGLGAEPAIPPRAGRPLAHFSQISVTSWQDDTTTNFNPVWAALKPHERGGNLRPWTTSEALGRVPVTAAFSASNSVDGLTDQSTSNTGIVSYNWDFGDGATVATNTAVATHAFLNVGEYWVTLTVTNSAGAYGSYSNGYRTLPRAPGGPPAPSHMTAKKP